MGLFELFTKLTHPEKRVGWVETTAYFTGDTQKPARGRVTGYHPQSLYTFSGADFLEYGIKYYADDRERIGWYVFSPLPDPDPEEIKGTTIKIRYKKSRPWIFENVENFDEGSDI